MRLRSEHRVRNGRSHVRLPFEAKAVDQPYTLSKRFFSRCVDESVSSAGNELTAVVDRSGGVTPVRMDCTIMSIASPVFGGITTVAASKPLRTQACPVFGNPSQPV
jgi:hypothetical protein